VWVKCTTSAECKIYSNSRVHGIGQPVQTSIGWSTTIMIIMMEVFVSQICSRDA
jgi:hypothetical protein